VQAPAAAPAAAPVAAAKKQQQQQQQQAAAAAAPRKPLSRAAAATRIQAFWRMYRLARYHKMLKMLAGISAATHQLSAKFAAAKEASQGVLTHKQYLELSELAMRLLLQLDATSCGAPELRQVRKRLTTAAIQLLDSIQAAYSSAVRTASASSSSEDVGTHPQQQQQQQAGAAVETPSNSSASGAAGEASPAASAAEEMELDKPPAAAGADTTDAGPADTCGTACVLEEEVLPPQVGCSACHPAQHHQQQQGRKQRRKQHAHQRKSASAAEKQQQQQSQWWGRLPRCLGGEVPAFMR
jgi:hypothetical protein